MTMDVIESAAAYAQNIAADDSHGYDQAGRWGLTTIAAVW